MNQAASHEADRQEPRGAAESERLPEAEGSRNKEVLWDKKKPNRFFTARALSLGRWQRSFRQMTSLALIRRAGNRCLTDKIPFLGAETAIKLGLSLVTPFWVCCLFFKKLPCFIFLCLSSSCKYELHKGWGLSDSCVMFYPHLPAHSRSSTSVC